MWTTPGLLAWLFGVTAIAWSLVVLWSLNDVVTEPYMDEIFHIPQTQRYCDGDFFKWNDKITTLPGLYLLALPLSFLYSICLGESLSSDAIACSPIALRSFNFVIGTCTAILVYKLLRTLHTQMDRAVGVLRALEVVLCPMYCLFLFVFYTDALSLFTVLIAYHLSLKERHVLSALAGAISIIVRQNNIIWVAFVCGCTLVRHYELGLLAPSSSTPASQLRPTQLSELPRATIEFTTTVLLNPIRIASLVWTYLLVAVGFVVFVVVNNGVVVGDRTSHVAVLHVPQLFYFVLFASCFSMFRLLNSRVLKSIVNDITSLTWRGWLLSIVIDAIIVVVIHKFTYAHKFLLADNRHYTFYLWKNVWARHPIIKYALLPVYMAGLWSCRQIIGQRSWLWQLVYWVAVSLVLIPSPLLEIRYFITPFAMLMLHAERPTRQDVGVWKVSANIVTYFVFNSVLLYVFIHKPFRWPDGSVARFMW